jgi:hypothetical protein
MKMENLNFEAFQILIFLIPGLVSAYVMDLMITRDKRSPFEVIIESLIFSFFIYLIVSPFAGKYPVFIETVDNQGSKASYLKYDNAVFGWIVIISLILPLIASMVHNYDWVMKLFRKLKISQRTSRKSTWNDAFLSNDVHIVINFSDGRRIYGWPEYFSEDPGKPIIYLHNPLWIDANNSFIESESNGILITDKMVIESIQFLKT